MKHKQDGQCGAQACIPQGDQVKQQTKKQSRADQKKMEDKRRRSPRSLGRVLPGLQRKLLRTWAQWDTAKTQGSKSRKVQGWISWAKRWKERQGRYSRSWAISPWTTKREQKEWTGDGRRLWNLRFHSKWCISSIEAIQPEPPQTASPIVDQVFKCRTLWGTTLIQTTTDPMEHGSWMDPRFSYTNVFLFLWTCINNFRIVRKKIHVFLTCPPLLSTMTWGSMRPSPKAR